MLNVVVVVVTVVITDVDAVVIGGTMDVVVVTFTTGVTIELVLATDAVALAALPLLLMDGA